MEPGRDLTKPPCWQDVAKWVVAAEKHIGATIIRNVWNMKRLEDFAPHAVHNDTTSIDSVGIANANVDEGGDYNHEQCAMTMVYMQQGSWCRVAVHITNI